MDANIAKSVANTSLLHEKHVFLLNTENEKSKNESHWHRVQWTDRMVKLLITSVSYIRDEAGSSRFFAKKGKWKVISKVMSERGFPVSPQQCEDKFNDLNKRYKKLNDILGIENLCRVVENPLFLDSIDIAEKSKGGVRKMLSSRQLFSKEMCSYHNGNWLNIPHDHVIQNLIRSALEGGENDASNCTNEDLGSIKVVGVRKKEHVDSDKILGFHIVNNKKQKLQNETEMIELEKRRLRWLKFSELEDRDLEKMRLENKLLKLENDRFGLEIRRREMGKFADANKM